MMTVGYKELDLRQKFAKSAGLHGVIKNMG